MNLEARCFCNLAPLYVLDLLDTEDRQWVEAQAATDLDLAAELKEMQVGVAAMAYSSAQALPSSNLKSRLWQSLDLEAPAEPEPMLAAPENQPVPNLGWGRRFLQQPVLTLPWVGGAIAGLLVTGLGINNLQLRTGLQQSKAVVDALEQPNTAIYPMKGTPKAAQAAGSILIDASQKSAVILARNLPDLPPAQVYRLWAKPQGASPIYCGQFDSGAAKTAAQWRLPSTVCSAATAQRLITAELKSAPLSPQGPLMMAEVL